MFDSKVVRSTEDTVQTEVKQITELFDRFLIGKEVTEKISRGFEAIKCNRGRKLCNRNVISL